MESPRSLAKAYANLNGYFWLPCPYPGCGRMFGGHESGDYVMKYPDDPSTGKMCCKLHDEDVPYKVFLRTGEWTENLTLPENYHPDEEKGEAVSEKLIFSDNAFVATVWPGNDLNPPTVELDIKTYRHHYDRDYGTEEEIIGNYDLSMDEARKLYDFLGKVLNIEEAGE